MRLISRLIILALLGISLIGMAPSWADRCSNYGSQLEAQRNYSRALDRDGDGVACESLPVGEPSPKTSNTESEDAENGILPTIERIIGNPGIVALITGLLALCSVLVPLLIRTSNRAQ